MAVSLGTARRFACRPQAHEQLADRLRKSALSDIRPDCHFPAHLAGLDNPIFAEANSEPPLAWGGAGLVSSACDYVRFAAMLLKGGSLDGKRVLSQAAVDLMLQNHLSEALIERGFVMGHQRIGPGRGFALNGSIVTDPGLAGVTVGRGTYQWDGAAGTWFWIDPANDLLCVGMTQTMSYTARALQAEMQALPGRLLVDAPA